MHAEEELPSILITPSNAPIRPGPILRNRRHPATGRVSINSTRAESREITVAQILMHSHRPNITKVSSQQDSSA